MRVALFDGPPRRQKNQAPGPFYSLSGGAKLAGQMQSDAALRVVGPAP
jgi:hypothetical protein